MKSQQSFTSQTSPQTSGQKTLGLYQRTLAHPVQMSGFGFWTGQDVVLEFRPAPENSGVYFIRTDIPGSVPIPAQVQYRTKKPRQTSLACGGVQVDMVEHLLATIRGMGIDNLEIRISGPEVPGFDGSSLSFIPPLMRGGIAEQKAKRPYRTIRNPHRFGNSRQWIEIGPPKEEGKTTFSYTIDYSEPGKPESAASCPIPRQTAEINLDSEEFLRRIAGARTFLLESEAKELRNLGLCRRVTAEDVLVFGPRGVISNKLRFPDEPARHKILDMIGDFSLTPFSIVGSFRAYRTGHQQNADALSEILELLDDESPSEEI